MTSVPSNRRSSLIVRGRRAIGDDCPAYVIAEIGTNHNRDYDTAVAMVRALGETGCDCVKFQIYEPEEIVSARVRAAEYGFDRLYGDISAQEMFERHLKTPKQWFPALKALCHDLGMDFCATIHGAQGVAWARSVGVDLVKIASMDHGNTPFLSSLANAVDAPLLVATGMAALADVDAAMAATRDHRAGVALFHCCSIYPAPEAETRLENIAVLRDRFPVPVGFSDHTLGIDAAVRARRLGAVLFEKHVSLDHTQPGPDHHFAMEMPAFTDYVRAIKTTTPAPAPATGAFLDPAPDEWANRLLALKSIITRRDLPAGAVIATDDVYCARPGTGIPPAAWSEVVGRKLTHAVAAETPLQWDDLGGAR